MCSITTLGNKYLLTFQNDLTKFSKDIPLPNKEATTVTKEFVTNIICDRHLGNLDGLRY